MIRVRNANNKIGCILVFMILIIAIISIAGVVTASDWPMFHHDLLHTGYSTSTAPDTNNTIWNFTTSDRVQSSPAVVDGKVYISSNYGHMYCLDAEDGDELWNSTMGGETWFSSPAIEDDRVYIGGTGLHCLNADNGSIIWIYPSGLHVSSSPAVVNGRVYVGTWYQGLCCFDADPDDNGDGVINHNPYDEIEDDDDEGYNDSFFVEYDLIWNYETGNFVLSSPAFYNDKVYFGSRDNKVYCLYSSNGTEIWNFTTGGSVDSSPTIVNGKLYIGSDDNKIYCLYVDNGTEVWTYTTSHNIISSPAVADDKVYVSSLDNKVYCLDATGNGDGTTTKIWSYLTGSYVYTSPAVADGKVYIGSNDKTVYCLDANNGTMIWEYKLEGRIEYSSPAIYNGKVYIGSYDKKVYCFGDIPDTNEPPRRPSQPIGSAEGKTDIEYKFSTTTTDPDGDQIYYWFNWGDGSNSGWVDAPNAIHSWTAVGDYELTVKAKDIYNAESGWSDPSTMQIVEQTSGEPEDKGWIFGSVQNALWEPIEAASVCLVISDVKDCVLTDEGGLYQIYVQTGDHTIEVKREGYESQTKIVTVMKNQAFNENFILEESEDGTEPAGETRDQIDAAIEAGTIGGEIMFQQEEHQISHVEVRYADIMMTPLEVDKEGRIITILVDGDEPTGKTIVIIIDRTVFTVEEVTVEYDGIAIKEASSFLDIIDYGDDGALPEYYVVTEQDQAFVLLSLPHFSEHTITISSVVEAINVLAAVILFVSITIVAILIFIVPVYHFYFRKVKE